jgi:hypothetical protein
MEFFTNGCLIRGPWNHRLDWKVQDDAREKREGKVLRVLRYEKVITK